MNLRNWFYSLGQKHKDSGSQSFYRYVYRQKSRQPIQVNSGAEQVCSQLCGKEQCQCGANFKGPYCLWNHYRL